MVVAFASVLLISFGPYRDGPRTGNSPILSTRTDSVLISCVHAPKQFAHGNAESAANGQQGREGRHSFAPLDQTDRCPVQAAMIGESLLAEFLLVPQLPHSLAQRQ